MSVPSRAPVRSHLIAAVALLLAVPASAQSPELVFLSNITGTVRDGAALATVEE